MGSAFNTTPAAPMPNNEPEGQVMNQQGMTEPSSIRDYLAIAKQGQARFTNIPGQAQPGTMLMNEDPSGQAISDVQVSDYERMPFSQRVGLSPYVRAKERVRTMLPELWATMFPGMQQGATLQAHQMKQWEGAVSKLTSSLLKHFDKQYGASIKMKKEMKDQRESDRRHWQQSFWKQKQMGRPILDEEQMPVSEAQYVQDRMNAGDEMRIKDQLRGQEPTDEPDIATERFTPEQMNAILNRNPELKRQMVFQIKSFMQQVLGNLDEQGFNEAMAAPQNASLKAEAIRDTMKRFNAEILATINQPQGMLTE